MDNHISHILKIPFECATSLTLVCLSCWHLLCVIGYHVLYACTDEDIHRNRYYEYGERCTAEVSVTLTPTVPYLCIFGSNTGVQTQILGFHSKRMILKDYNAMWFYLWENNPKQQTVWHFSDNFNKNSCLSVSVHAWFTLNYYSMN